MDFKGFKQVNGLAEDFDENTLENGYVYFVRTSDNKDSGYIWLNGKKYGTLNKVIDCGDF